MFLLKIAFIYISAHTNIPECIELIWNIIQYKFVGP